MKELFFIFLLTITRVSPLNSVIAANPKKGFTMKMIHIDSKESPLYPGDHLTREQKLQRLVEQSKAQAHYIESQILIHRNATHSMNIDVARLPVVYEPRRFYVAEVGLGTFPGRQQPFMNYYLMIDSGSDGTWLQCEGANDSFTQDMPFYPWNLSTTYRPALCNTHPKCSGDKCNAAGQCTYILSYASGSVTSGIVAKEKFILGSATGGFESIDLYMGCGFLQKNFGNIGNNHQYGKYDLIAGILGLGSGQWSFINQLGATGQGKFSYCFELFNSKINGSDTYLRFGADAKIGRVGQEVRTTPIVVPQFQTSQYYLNLEDISVGNKRINFPKGTFKFNSQGEGGTIIDSGAPLSHMHKDHFDIVAGFVKAHFNELGVEYIGSRHSFDVCFRLRGRFDITSYPSMTLHFQQADYVISDYKANFVMISAQIICLGIFRQDNSTLDFILGAMQQANKRILYDVMNNSLSFATEHCELGS